MSGRFLIEHFTKYAAKIAKQAGSKRADLTGDQEMILKKVYVCEFCKTEYGAEQSAKSCEQNHVKPKSVKALRYNGINDDRCPAPIMVTVTMCNGESFVYRRCSEGNKKEEHLF